MILRQTGDASTTWQLILADLALILFLVTLAALAAYPNGTSAQGPAEREAAGERTGPTNAAPSFAPSQALYRPGAQGPTLAEWLAAQAPDRRASVTIYARHPKGDASAAWQRADMLAREARAQGFRVRVVIERGGRSEIHASLGYDVAPGR